MRVREYGGYIFVIDEAKRAVGIEEYIERNDTFTDTISAPDWQAKKAEMFLISLSKDHLNYISLARRGNMVATQKYQIRFSNFYEFDEAIPMNALHSALDYKSQTYFSRSSSGIGNRIPPKTWTNLMEAIKKLRPDSASALDRLEKLLNLEPGFFNRSGIETMVQERDAINISLRIAGFEPKSILNWTPRIRSGGAGGEGISCQNTGFSAYYWYGRTAAASRTE
jgi:hypothetical protein